MAYVVPAGKRLVIKNITIVWGNITVSGLDAWLQDAGLSKLVRYTWTATFSDPTNIGGVQQWWGMWVFDEGEEVFIQNQAGACDIQAHGYLLDAP